MWGISNEIHKSESQHTCQVALVWIKPSCWETSQCWVLLDMTSGLHLARRNTVEPTVEWLQSVSNSCDALKFKSQPQRYSVVACPNLLWQMCRSEIRSIPFYWGHAMSARDTETQNSASGQILILIYTKHPTLTAVDYIWTVFSI